MTPEEFETYCALLYAGKKQEAEEFRAEINNRIWEELGE